MLSVSLVGDKAVFEVADNGCGLSGCAQKIFSGSYEKSAAPVDGTRSNMGSGYLCALPLSKRTAARLPKNREAAAVRIPLCAGKRG